MWLAKQIHLVPSDLALKHKTMKRDAFLFFRSTFYRWMQVAHLLYAMGWERANVHLGTHKAIRAIQRDLATRTPKWLHRASKQMASATISDWTEWRKT